MRQRDRKSSESRGERRRQREGESHLQAATVQVLGLRAAWTQQGSRSACFAACKTTRRPTT